MRSLGYRFPNIRTRYIVEARRHIGSIKKTITSISDAKRIREWLIKNVKGIGPKEASHFLRNIGFTNLAILDFHIINILTRYGIIVKPKNLTWKRYLEIEEKIRNIADQCNINMAELDLYLWYMEREKILK